jgi:putrescine transport system permease protein
VKPRLSGLRWRGRHLVVALPALWLTFAFLAPFLILLRLSVSEMDDNGAANSLFGVSDGVAALRLTMSHYAFVLQDDLYLLTYLGSLKYAAITTALCLLTGYPFAWFMARARPGLRPVLMMLVMLPFWTSFLLRIYAWKGILANNGILNDVLLAVGVIDAPLHIMNTPVSLTIGMVYAYLPFMILPAVRQPGEDRPALPGGGCRPWRDAAAGILARDRAAVDAGNHRRLDAGIHTCGGRVRDPRTARRPRYADDRARAVGRVFHQQRLAAGVRPRGGCHHADPGSHDRIQQIQKPARGAGMSAAAALRTWFARAWLAAVYLFLYLPIVVLVVFSFNASQQDMVWAGFSTKWYGELLHDSEITGGFALSLKIAVASAFSSVLLGTCAAFALARYRRFRGRTLFAAMVSAPLVMPEVIIGLSLLLMLVAVQKTFGFPDRGMLTIWVGHTLLGMAYATVVVQSRLREISRSLEEAAMDLGCRAHQVFFLVTLPNITQALASAWLLTFTLSLDDVVLSAFLSGPGSSTMPIVIFSRARLGIDPRVNAVAAITIFVVSAAVIAACLVMARAERRRQRQLALMQHAYLEKG